MPKKPFTFKFSDETIERLKALCKKLEATKTAVIERAIREFFGREKP